METNHPVDKTINQIISDSEEPITPEESYQLAYTIFKNYLMELENLPCHTSNSFYHDLEIFTGHKLDQFNSIFQQLNSTKTQLGKIKLQDMLSRPINSSYLLRSRQDKVNLLHKTDIIAQTSRLISVGKFEPDVLWFWKTKNAELRELFNIVLFNHRFFRKLNEYQSVLKWYNYLRIIIYPVYGLVSPLIWLIVPYYLGKYFMGQDISFDLYEIIICNIN